MPRRTYRTHAEARAASVVRNRRWHYAYTPSSLPWRVVVDGTPVAVFMIERDARGFALARYGEDAIVERRMGKGGRPRIHEAGELA